MPKLTVMMPALNAARTIESAVRSTLRAMPNDSELLIWDDGSVDSTGDRVEAIADNRIRLVRSETSVGGGEARRRMIAGTDSDLVASMDADDLCMPWRFRAQIPALQGADLVFGSVVRFGDSIRQLRPSAPFAYNPFDASAALLFHSAFSHPTALMRRAAIVEAGNYSDLRVAQDYELWLRLAAQGANIRKVARPVVAYRQSQSQVSRSEGYTERVRSQAQLGISYSAAAERFFGDTPRWREFAKPTTERELDAVGLANDLASLIPKLSLQLRRHYGKHLSRGRTTMFGASPWPV
ncbi:glycosyltransferase [Demequina sp. SYSU T00039]|uniref:Glycosyltransferase n=1 Tax=Demequina lignilytica TaxID=3051663 RepID=A0AAW7M8V9_9MICO|nr:MULTISPECIES: glycosyltransferase [unclassified Demequina]MDN4477444.1 glycosyltransferase [Demequina sp. SYSU T00039-1]MDN4488205.1 glycosyltransferase [Demequina sp. SYSU T00039]